jgi:hypothetical protein
MLARHLIGCKSELAIGARWCVTAKAVVGLSPPDVVSLHRLASITIGVPNVEDTCRYHDEFGLTHDGISFSTSDGGEQLHIVESPTRRLIELCIGTDDPDDLDRVADRLTRLGVTSQRDPDNVSAVEIHSGARAVVQVLPRISQDPTAVGPYNAPGHTERENRRAPGCPARRTDPPPKTGARRHRHPAGNFSEYYSDMDIITDDQLWTPGTWEPSLRSLYAWGPRVPPSMLTPDDLAHLMAASHQS